MLGVDEMREFKNLNKVTNEHLAQFWLCLDGVNYFYKKYPKGMDITLQNLREVRFNYFQYWLWKYDNKLWERWRDGYQFMLGSKSNVKAIDYLWTQILKRDK